MILTASARLAVIFGRGGAWQGVAFNGQIVPEVVSVNILAGHGENQRLEATVSPGCPDELLGELTTCGFVVSVKEN